VVLVGPSNGGGGLYLACAAEPYAARRDPGIQVCTPSHGRMNFRPQSKVLLSVGMREMFRDKNSFTGNQMKPFLVTNYELDRA